MPARAGAPGLPEHRKGKPITKAGASGPSQAEASRSSRLKVETQDRG